ncbi:carboxymuconolactone decarboxylase family protein [Spongiimicrobium sp. 2-473A-2-J]|uniref:carboxymuconolactone decarboxylase family protein n=1 Tax=Eudoraea algarum TaxID=3417568 RepID=UPI003D36A052
MARVKLVEFEEASPELQASYTKSSERFEMLLNIFKAWGVVPNLCIPMTDFIMEILQDGFVDWKTKELVILKSTLENECEYCVTQHEVVSRRLGIPDEKVADLKGVVYQTSPHFTEGEKAILDLTLQIRDDANRVSPELWARIREHWTEQQIVEIVYTITAYIMVSKFGDALHVELEPVFSDLKTQLI